MRLLTVKVSYMIDVRKSTTEIRQEPYNTNSLTVLIDDAIEIQNRRWVSIKMNQ